MIEIIRYEPKYEGALMSLIRAQGEDWRIYWEEPNASKYKESLSECVTFLALCDGRVCGYSRSIKDALCVYVCDLLVGSKFRGNGLGERLIRPLKEMFTDADIYIMSGNDEYYSKLGCKMEGSIYLYK